MSGRVALVTGASSGLGREIARELVRVGYVVGLVARRRERLDALAAELGVAAHAIPGDLRDAAFSAGVVDQLVARTGRLDLLVNNAGAPVASGASVASDVELDETFALNVRAAYRLAMASAPHLERTRGSIVSIGSAGVARTIPIDLVYLASKGALEIMSRGLAKSWAPRGIRVNVVSPGLIRTEIFEAAGMAAADVPAAWAEATARFQPLPREGAASDVAKAVAYLASEAAAFITGATLHVDGGMALGG